MNLLSLTLLALPLVLQQPTPKNGDSSLDQLVDQVIEYRKQRAELEKKESATLAEVRTRLKALEDRLNQIDVKPPVPPDPAPPLPNPPQPNPVDPLAVAIAAAYKAEISPQKAEQAKTLAELYLQASAHAADASILTTAQLMAKIKAAADSLRIDGLDSCRRLIALEAYKALGALEPPVALDAATRAKAKELFLRIHIALKGVG